MGYQNKEMKSGFWRNCTLHLLLFGMFAIVALNGCKREIAPDEPSAAGMVFKPYGMEDLMDANVTSGNQILILGMSQGKTYLIKTTQEGIMIWKKELSLSAEFPGNVESQPDGSILIFGTTYEKRIAPELSIIKMSDHGEILKTTVVRIKENDPDFKYPIYGTHYNNFYAPDKEGGYFIQTSLSTIYSFQSSHLAHVIHYNDKDSVDQIVDLTKAIPSRAFEMINGKNGKLNMLSVVFSPLRLLITQYDRSNFLTGKMVEVFEEEIELIGEQIRSVTDENHAYIAQFKTDPGANITDGMQISKTDLNTGKMVEKWIIPLNIGNSQTYSIWFMPPQVKDDAIYFPLMSGNDAYIVQSSKNGKQFWVKSISGNVSRDWISKLLPAGDELLVFGKGSNNRGYEQTLFMLRMDKSGNIISK